MAQAFFNHLAKQRGLDAIAGSAGTAPAEQVNPMAVQVMEEVGICLGDHQPQRLVPELTHMVDRIITMGCGVDAEMCPAGTYITEDWQLADPHGQPIAVVREIRDAVRRRVEGLLGEIAGPTEPGR